MPDTAQLDMERLGLRGLLVVAWRLMWRDWRGGELRLLFFALVLAVTSVTGIALFTDRLERALMLESANMLAADRVLHTREPAPAEINAEAVNRGFRTASTLSFTSMAFSDNGNMLVAAKAVSDEYPLRGEVITTRQPFTRGAPVASGPPPGEVWLESRALPALGVEVGDQVSVGETELTVGAVIIAEPDRGQGGIVDNAGPRLMLHMDDVAATNVVQLGSRVSYRSLFAHDDFDRLDEFELWVRDTFEGNYYIRDVREESEEVAEALDRAEGYLLLGSLFAVLLAGLAIALSARRYSERHYDYVAILKTLGCTSGRISAIYLLIQLKLAAVAVALGSALGYLVHEGILRALQASLQVDLPPPGAQPYAVGAMTAFICLLSFALPPLLALRETPPLRVLRKDLTQTRFSDRIPYAFGIGGSIFLIWWYSQDLVLTSLLVAGVAGTGLLLSLISLVFLTSSGSAGMKAGNAWKLAMTAVRRRRRQNVLQVMVFSVTIMSLLILGLLRTDLIADWQAQLPENTPNHFMMNITGSQVEGIETFFTDNAVDSNAFYPLISARVRTINGSEPEPEGEPGEEERGASLVENNQFDDAPATDAAPGSGESAEAEGRRVRGRLSRRQVTWAIDLPADNRVTAGDWWPENPRPGLVSVDEEYADWLNIEIGDTMEFEINQQFVSAEVANFRSVRWDNMQPNFFIIFSPGTIDHLGATFLSTVLLETEQKLLLNDLIRQFPTIVVVEVDALIEQIQNIISQVTSAIELIFALVLVAGALVLLACVSASLDERFHENAILRTLGAGRRLILTSLLIEFAFIGVVAGTIATLGAEGGLFYLQEWVFEQEFNLHYWVWIAGPALGTVLIACLGVNSTRKVVNTSPLTVLRRVV
ncbi:MAG: FtsX-like permease family protein [Gammaproteobacteria bacterium]|nr:FtsX-like permease family protein [Gammaproteobacteria bacterium]MYH85722.1 FtsX-like permease family protein [Gammaproteobacteria bacterium]MYK04018.1 FtsX-like permease family protein [Gammaproteobacteria bacterium]